ncbi:hypothetical protein [Burkholderia ubonensis]|uniref:hypothetical protein n=1 Tax=Burkholderia ubonensis TaxID=101571 RepID=UPI000AB96036|nr:hypothetical protein [Burkholderia ubonensis]
MPKIESRIMFPSLDFYKEQEKISFDEFQRNFIANHGDGFLRQSAFERINNIANNTIFHDQHNVTLFYPGSGDDFENPLLSARKVDNFVFLDIYVAGADGILNKIKSNLDPGARVAHGEDRARVLAKAGVVDDQHVTVLVFKADDKERCIIYNQIDEREFLRKNPNFKCDIHFDKDSFEHHLYGIDNKIALTKQVVGLLHSPGMMFTNSPDQIDQHSLRQISTFFESGISINGAGDVYVLRPEQFIFSEAPSPREVISNIMTELTEKEVGVFSFGDPKNNDPGDFEAIVKILEKRLPTAPKDTLGDIVCDALLQANTFLDGKAAIEARICMRQSFPNYWTT